MQVGAFGRWSEKCITLPPTVKRVTAPNYAYIKIHQMSKVCSVMSVNAVWELPRPFLYLQYFFPTIKKSLSITGWRKFWEILKPSSMYICCNVHEPYRYSISLPYISNTSSIKKFQLNATNLIKINIFVGTKFLYYGTFLWKVRKFHLSYTN
jgi:hypothetical protein